jgi:hypothetical protein
MPRSHEPRSPGHEPNDRRHKGARYQTFDPPGRYGIFGGNVAIRRRRSANGSATIRSPNTRKATAGENEYRSAGTCSRLSFLGRGTKGEGQHATPRPQGPGSGTMVIPMSVFGREPQCAGEHPDGSGRFAPIPRRKETVRGGKSV